jgi:hypothetical protein
VIYHAQLHRFIVGAHSKAGSFPGGEVLLTEVLERLRDAQNDHDLDAFVACFHPGLPQPAARAS